MIKNLQKQVAYILQNYPDTRNSDISLMIAIWVNYYGVGETLVTKRIYDLPREDNVKRLRAKFCEEKFSWAYPTDPKVAKARKIKEDEWRSALGYMPPKKTVYFENNNQVTKIAEDQVEEYLKLNPRAIKLS